VWHPMMAQWCYCVSVEKQALLQAAGCQPGPAYDSKHRTKPQPGPAYDSGSAYAADIGTSCPENPTSTTRNKSQPKKIKPPPMSSLDPADNPVKVNQLTKPASNKAPDHVHVRQIIPHHADDEAEKPVPGLAPDSRLEVASALQHHHPSQAQSNPRTYPQYPPPIPMYHYQVAPSQNQQIGGYGTIAQVGTHPQQVNCCQHLQCNQTEYNIAPINYKHVVNSKWSFMNVTPISNHWLYGSLSHNLNSECLQNTS